MPIHTGVAKHDFHTQCATVLLQPVPPHLFPRCGPHGLLTNATTTSGEIISADRGNSAAIYTPALDDLRREFGDRWDVAAIPQGYRAILRDTGGHAPVALYGRTPAELAESIRMAQVPS